MIDITAYLAPNGQQITQGKGPATRILVGTLNGVATLERSAAGKPWTLTGRSLEDRHIGSLLHEEGSGRLFAGAHDDGGLWLSDDGEGASWRQLTKGLDRPHIYSLAARRTGDRVTLFAGTSPVGLYRSEDLGESWTEVTSIFDASETDKWTFPPPPHIPHVKQVVFHPTEPETIYVLVEQGALLKSVDDGTTWEELSAYSAPQDEVYRDVHRLVIRPDDPEKFYLATGVGICRSADGGRSFEYMMRRGDRVGYPDFVFLDPGDSEALYMGGALTNPGTWRKTRVADSCVMHSPDRGDSWAVLDNGLPKPVVGAIEAMCQHLWDGGMMLAAGTATGEVYVTEDGGESWQVAAEGIAPVAKDHHYQPFLPEDQLREAMAHREALERQGATERGHA